MHLNPKNINESESEDFSSVDSSEMWDEISEHENEKMEIK